MDLESKYEISRVASFILKENFSRVALQFPDELLKDSTLVVKFLHEKLVSCNEGEKDVKDVRLYVMADTTYGSCCVDEVGASHINADCVIHFGHTCLSQTSNLPALFVFGKEPISASNCAQQLCSYALTTDKPILVLYGLEYAYALQEIKEAYMVESMTVCGSSSKLDLQYADVMDTVIFPSNTSEISKVHTELVGSYAANEDNANTAGRKYRIGGLHWSVMEGRSIEDYVLFWVGTDNSAFANVVLTFNGCEIVRYDAKENLLETDFSQQRRILKRRYYLVEKAKDATIVGILVGTLGIAGYLSMIHQIKEIITKAGKKAYTLVMGRPNPAKLANFPECDVFVYVSCAQTALLDSKEFLAPVITPFEAMLAFGRGSQWTGRYEMEFQGLITSPHPEVDIEIKEARFSFLQGGYVEDVDLEETDREDKDETLALVNVTEKALLVRDRGPQTLVSTAKSGAEFFASRSFQGLDINTSSLPEPFVVGRAGKASGYDNEKSMH